MVSVIQLLQVSWIQDRCSVYSSHDWTIMTVKTGACFVVLLQRTRCRHHERFKLFSNLYYRAILHCLPSPFAYLHFIISRELCILCLMTQTVRKAEYCAVNTYLYNDCAVTAYNDLWGFTTSVISRWRPLLCRYLCVRTCPCMGVNTVLSYQQQTSYAQKFYFSVRLPVVQKFCSYNPTASCDAVRLMSLCRGGYGTWRNSVSSFSK